MPQSKADRDRMQEDFSAKVEALLPEQIKNAKSGKLEEAIENILALEKQTRQVNNQ